MTQELDMTQGKIPGLIRKIAVPTSVGFFFHTMFNVVDTLYAGRMSTETLAGMALSSAVFFIILSFSFGLGTGTTALISNSLGEKDAEKAKSYLYNALILGVVISLILAVLGQYLAPVLFRMMGAEGATFEAGIRYLRVIFMGTLFMMLNSILNSGMTSQGNTKAYRNVLIIAFFLNIILDPLFVLGWFGLPKMGTAGLALATVIVQVVGNVYMVIRLKNSPLIAEGGFRHHKASLKRMGEILQQGIPSSMNMMTIALGSFVMNYFIVKYGGDTAVAAYGAGIRIEQIVLLPSIGLNTAALTITGQNYGARRMDRIVETYKTTLKYGLMMQLAGMFLLYTFAAPLIGIFNSDPAVVSNGVMYLRIEYLTLMSYIVLHVTNSVLQGLKKPTFAMLIGLYRQLLIPLMIFPFLAVNVGMGIKGVWWGIFITNWSAVVIALVYAYRKFKEISANEEVVYANKVE